MFNDVLLLFLALHFLADFYFKTEKTAISKTAPDKGWQSRVKFFFTHFAIYFGIMLIPSIVSWFSIRLLVIGAIAGSTHAVIDIVAAFLKSRVCGSNPKRNSIVYFVDQLIQLLVIFLLCSYFPSLVEPAVSFEFVSFLTSYDPLMKWITSIVVLCIPSNVFFRNFCDLIGVEKESPKNNNNNGNNASVDIKNNDEAEFYLKNGGAVIGCLERCLILISVVTKQYMLIAVVLTCKGFARFSHLNESAFAEFFLIGTMFSIIITFVVYWLVFNPSLSNI